MKHFLGNRFYCQILKTKPLKSKRKIAFSLIELSVVILIIGVLVLGVTQGSRMMKEAKLKSARSLTTSSPVVSIENLAMWLDSTAERSLNDAERVDGGTISNWYNVNPQSSDNKINNVTQTTTAKKPLYVVNGIGGLPSIRFDGDDYLSIASNSTVDLPTSNNPRTLFVVFGNAHLVPGGWNFLLHYGTEEIMNQTFDFGACSTSALHTWATEYKTTKSLCDKKPYIVSITYKGLSNTTLSNGFSFYINGTSYANDNANARTSGTEGSSATLTLNTTSNDLYIGSRMNGADPFKGDIGEIIMYDKRLNETERVSVENYLKQKWGINY